MSVREDFLALLRTDQSFHEEVRRQLLTEEVLSLPKRVDRLTEVVSETTSLLQETVKLVQGLTRSQLQVEQRLDRVEATLVQLAEAQQRTTERLDRVETSLAQLAEAQNRTEERLQQLAVAQEHATERLDRLETSLTQLAEAQRHTEEALKELLSWQRGEAGRRDGERYERDTLRRAPALFIGGRGGSPDQPWVQERLTECVASLLMQEEFEAEEDPFLADLLWWKEEQVAVAEISVQVDSKDVTRAARRAETLGRAGLHVIPVVIGEDWARSSTREQASIRHVEWKVGSDFSAGLLAFRRRLKT